VSTLELNSKVSNNIIRFISRKIGFRFFWVAHIAGAAKAPRHSATQCNTMQLKETEKNCNKDSFHTITHTHNQCIEQLVRIFGPELIRINELIKTARSAVSNTLRYQKPAVFFLRRQPRNFENVTLLAACRREHFWGFWAIFWVAQLSPTRGVLVHKNSLASCQRCRHSVEPRAMTCPFKQSNLSAWSLMTWHPTHKYLWGRLCFDLTKGLLFDTFVITVWYKLCC